MNRLMAEMEKTMDEQKLDWVSTAYVAEKLGVSRGKARQVIRDSGIAIYMVGNRIRVIRKDADEMVERLALGRRI